MFTRKIGIDLGTCNSIVFTPQKGVILQEPSVVAVTMADNRILAVGREAKEMTGRTPDTIRIYRPLRDGVIADYRVTEAMLKYFVKKTPRTFRFLKPEMLVGVPAGITSTEKRAVIEAGMAAGAKGVYVAKEPILAAIGAGIPINSCSGHMIVDIGGGTSEVAVISLGGIVTSCSLRVAGDKMDQAISDYIKKKYNLAIGEQTAENLKVTIGNASPDKKIEKMEVKGTDAITGLPRRIEIDSVEIREALQGPINSIIEEIKRTLGQTPPELAADIVELGIVMTGGGALLKGLPKLIAKETGVPVILAENPMLCVVLGAGKFLENLKENGKKVYNIKV